MLVFLDVLEWQSPNLGFEFGNLIANFLFKNFPTTRTFQFWQFFIDIVMTLMTFDIDGERLFFWISVQQIVNYLQRPWRTGKILALPIYEVGRYLEQVGSYYGIAVGIVDVSYVTVNDLSSASDCWLWYRPLTGVQHWTKQLLVWPTQVQVVAIPFKLAFSV